MILSKSINMPSVMLCRSMSSSTAAATKRRADVVVLGGGMVGSSLACAMAASPYFAGKQITLLEGAPKKSYVMKPEYSNRVNDPLTT